MTWDDIAGMLPVLIFVLLMLRKPLQRLREAAQKRRETEQDKFQRDYKPIEPD